MTHTKPTTYRLQLTVNNDASTLKLLQEDTLVQETSWPEERDMGRQLLSALKTLLDESGVDPKAVTSFDIDGDAKENFTSRRIAETVRNTFLFAIDQ